MKHTYNFRIGGDTFFCGEPYDAELRENWYSITCEKCYDVIISGNSQWKEASDEIQEYEETIKDVKKSWYKKTFKTMIDE